MSVYVVILAWALSDVYHGENPCETKVFNSKKEATEYLTSGFHGSCTVDGARVFESKELKVGLHKKKKTYEIEELDSVELK